MQKCLTLPQVQLDWFKKKKKKKVILCCADPPIKTSPIKYLLRLCLLHFKAYHYKVAGVCFTT